MEQKSVLIIEDEPAIREMMQNILEIEGYKLYTASNGADGIEILRAAKPPPCVILLDLMMPGTNGWQFLDAQRSDPELSRIPVVICSAYRESARAVKPAAFIEKPIQLHALLGAVKAFCE